MWPGYFVYSGLYFSFSQINHLRYWTETVYQKRKFWRLTWWEDVLREVFQFLILWFAFGTMSVILLRVWQNQTLPYTFKGDCSFLHQHLFPGQYTECALALIRLLGFKSLFKKNLDCENYLFSWADLVFIAFHELLKMPFYAETKEAGVCTH